MWLSTNYVRQDQFLKLIDTQNEKFFQQENKTKNQFDNVQNKLEIIINQQTIFNEQIKTFNTLLANYQKQYDNLYERVLYLERTRKAER
jgi:predicted nuclease with TOPRIM domain